MRAWWKESTVYQIYPASFKDSSGDGIGDLKGIISKLDYIQGLGVDIVWLNPIFSSPQVDMGYDISDYYDIHPPYGTMEDVNMLAEGLHKRGMKLLMDLVVNHTSDQHPWFQEAISSVSNPRRDCAWEYDERSGEYYLHLFAKEQPDLNWENVEVRKAVHRIIRFWLERGVHGFRMDVINFISKDQSFPDAAIVSNSRWQNGSAHYACGPRLHEYLQEIGAILKEYNAFSVGEMPEVNDYDEILKAVGFQRGELNMIFHFEIVSLDHGDGGKFTAKDWNMQELKSVVLKWQKFMHENDGWNALYLENHDQPRIVSRFGSDQPENREQSAKMLAAFLGFQSGTLFIYQGQELGMPNVPRNWGIDQYRDIETLHHWKEVVSEGLADPIVSLGEYRLKSRDNARTPMQWDASVNAGFSTSTPWISVHDDYQKFNAASQITDKHSVYHFWSTILALRKSLPDLLVYGSFDLISSEHPDMLGYMRVSDSGRVAVVVANFRPWAVAWTPPHFSNIGSGEIVLTNYPGRRSLRCISEEPLNLEPLETFLWLQDMEESSRL
uniref:Alpha-glucosidase n=1 Tax=Talaromyces marneffei PM1 TaxID=1077442 RepID=A0A093VHE3_TALMA